MRGALIWLTAVVWLQASVAVQAQVPAQTVDEAYAPYAGLIGVWETDGGAITQHFSWGAGRSYIQYSTATRDASGAEHIHFEGMLLFNPQSQGLDFLIALEPGSLEMERGSLHVEADGVIVRDVELVGPNGVHGRFRQTFRLHSADAGETSLLQDDGHGGWRARFPGSDHLEMRRVGG